MHGLLVLDKPLELSSNHALQRVKRLLNAKKAGHTGTLDPLATGALVICLGRATKIADHITSASKRYFVIAKLGEQTATGDLEGDVVQQAEVTQQHIDKLEATIPHFLGEIEQIPPMFSAIKKDGVPLYKLARQGQEVERAARKVTIKQIEIGEITSDTVTMTVQCSKGTYIRTLVEDIGKELGCYAHVQTLRRLSVGDFGRQYPMVTLEEIEAMQAQEQDLEKLILPTEAAFSEYPFKVLNHAFILMLLKGMKLQLLDPEEAGYLCIYDTQRIFRGLAVIDQGRIVKFNQFYPV